MPPPRGHETVEVWNPMSIPITLMVAVVAKVVVFQKKKEF
jgi:hypothetical protein